MYHCRHILTGCDARQERHAPARLHVVSRAPANSNAVVMTCKENGSGEFPNMRNFRIHNIAQHKKERRNRTRRGSVSSEQGDRNESARLDAAEFTLSRKAD